MKIFPILCFVVAYKGVVGFPIPKITFIKFQHYYNKFCRSKQILCVLNLSYFNYSKIIHSNSKNVIFIASYYYKKHLGQDVNASCEIQTCLYINFHQLFRALNYVLQIVNQQLKSQSFLQYLFKMKNQSQHEQHVVKQTDVIQRKVNKYVFMLVTKGKHINQYKKIKNIGQGSYSKIKLMLNTQNQKYYAMKKYNLFILKKKTRMRRNQQGKIVYSSVADDIKYQIQVMKPLNHKNVAKLYEILYDKEQQKIYMIMDYCQKGQIATWNSKDLKFQLKIEQSFQNVREKFIQIVQGLQYLHQNNVVHRDIKPLNILVDKDDCVKIIDFGRSVKLKSNDQKLKGSQGTYHFMAPQMLTQKDKAGYDGKYCDIWSLGVSFYAMLFGDLPFYHSLELKLFEMIEKGNYKLPQKIDEKYQKFVPLIKEMLSIEPKEKTHSKLTIKSIEKFKKLIFCTLVYQLFFDKSQRSARIKDRYEQVQTLILNLRIQKLFTQFYS